MIYGARMRHVVVLISTVVACGGAATPVATPVASASAPPSSAPSAVATAPPVVVEQRPPPPENFRVLAGEGFSIFVPSAWKPIQAAPGAQAFASYAGADEGMSLQIAKVAFSGPEPDFVAGVTKGVTSSGATQTSTNTLAIAGRQVPITAFTHTKPGPTIRGVMRMQTVPDHFVSVTCHSAESNWNDKTRAECDPIFASIRLGAAAHSGAVPASKRWLSGSDWRVSIPAAWTDDTPHSPEVRALARSSNDEHTMVVVTIGETPLDAKPTDKTRDVLLNKLAGLVLAKEGTHGSIKRAAPNVVDIDFTRQLEGQTTGLVNAHFFSTDGAYLVTCGGLRASMEAHHDICETAVRSMRLDHPK